MRAPIDLHATSWHGPLDLSAAVRAAVSRLGPALPGRVRLECHLAPDLPLLEADRRQVEALVAQLVGEAAAELGPRGGWIRLETLSGVLGDAFLARSEGGPDLAPGCFVCLRVGGGATRSAAAGQGARELAASPRSGAVREIVSAHGAALAVERGADGVPRTTVAFPPAQRLRAARALPPLPSALAASSSG